MNKSWSEILQHYDVDHSEVRVGPDLNLHLAHIRDINALVDAMGPEDFGEDERLPYWACIWPVAHHLASYMIESPDLLEGPVLEMGCGLGLVSLAIASTKQKVLATDYELDALSFARHNAELNGVQLELQQWDWRDLDQMKNQFKTVVAADVLYEPRHVEPVAHALSQVVQTGGTALVADPNRPHWPQFQDILTRLGFEIKLDKNPNYTIIQATKLGVFRKGLASVSNSGDA